MTIYLLTFAVSFVASYCSDKIELLLTRKSKWLKVGSLFLMMIAILSVSILAGCRDYTIGTDVLMYGNPWLFNAIKYHSNPSLYLKLATQSSIGYLYALFNYIVAQFTSNPHWFYFWYSLTENFVIYWAIRRNKEIITPNQGWSVYLLLFYNSTLNVLRNWMALAIILWGFKYIRERKLIRYLITVYVAYLFHSSAYIGLLPYIVNLFLQRDEGKNKNIHIKKLIIIFITSIFVIFFIQIINHFAEVGVVSERYQEYVKLTTSGGFMVHLIGLGLPTLLLFVIQQKLRGNKNFELFETYAWIMTLLGLLINIYAYLSRIALYFDVYLIYSLPFVIKNGISFKFRNIRVNNLILFAYLVIYWLLIYGYLKSGETVPYMYMQS